MDIETIRSKRAIVEGELNQYLSDPVLYHSYIVNARGRLLRLLNMEYVMETDPVVKANIKSEIERQTKLHLEQLNGMGRKDTDDMFYSKTQISAELAVKIERLKENIKNIKNAQDKKEKIVGALKVGGNVLDIGVTLIKEPIVAIVNSMHNGESQSLSDRLIVQPMQMSRDLFSGITNPNSPHNGVAINYMNVFLQNQVSKLFGLANKAVNNATKGK